MAPNKRKFCLMHANCQGEPVAALLARHPDFSRGWELRHISNYTGEEVPDAALARCDLFVYQHLGEKWGELASARLLGRLHALSSGAASFQMPNLLFKGYWPFWTMHSPIDYGDTVLNRLIEAGAQKPEILKIYLHGDIRKFTDPDANLAETLRIQREKEEGCAVRTWDILAERWADPLDASNGPLMYSINHPGRLILERICNGLLDYLGLAPLPPGLAAAYTPDYADFELPIHPALARHFKLPFAGSGHEFNIYGRRMTFEAYISRYIDCRLNGYEADFISYLQLV
ncbi:hypothetical protein LJC36_00675 [Desulfovibrio sp. OttesenSCG-928-C14]|nr:hypothetical protein [Desulfovibrio sp. OttesenSCG-928-C14]